MPMTQPERQQLQVKETLTTPRLLPLLEGGSFNDQSTFGFQALLSELSIALPIFIGCCTGLASGALFGRAWRCPCETISLGEFDGTMLDLS